MTCIMPKILCLVIIWNHNQIFSSYIILIIINICFSTATGFPRIPASFPPCSILFSGSDMSGELRYSVDRNELWISSFISVTYFNIFWHFMQVKVLKLGGPIVFLSGVDDFRLHFDYFSNGIRNSHITRVPLETFID